MGLETLRWTFWGLHALAQGTGAMALLAIFVLVFEKPRPQPVTVWIVLALWVAIVGFAASAEFSRQERKTLWQIDPSRARYNAQQDIPDSGDAP